MTLELTQEEAQQLVSLLDAAVRGSGMQAAGAAVLIFDKLQAAANAKDEDNGAD